MISDVVDTVYNCPQDDNHDILLNLSLTTDNNSEHDPIHVEQASTIRPHTKDKTKKRKRVVRQVPSFYQLPSSPLFYIAGGNGVALVASVLEGLGWKQTTDKNNENYKLKWVDCRNKINYSIFKEGEQLVNRIPNHSLLTNKLCLLTILKNHENMTINILGRVPHLKIKDFYPETYNLGDANDRLMFLQSMKENETWICKPSGMNQGKGIYLIRNYNEIVNVLQERDEKQQLLKVKRPFAMGFMPRIIQRYISKPLLLDGHKFDIRSYMLIASTTPYVVLYRQGYVRLSCNKYSLDDPSLTTHLTNQYIQKKDPMYEQVKEETIWSMEKFNDYVNRHVAHEKNLQVDWVLTSLTEQMQRIIKHCFRCVKNKLQIKLGYFDLYGLDFMVDEDMKVWLIEINVNPSLQTNCVTLRDVIPSVIRETLQLVLECFEKSKKRQPILPLKSLKNFVQLNISNTFHSGSVSSKPAKPQTCLSTSLLLQKELTLPRLFSSKIKRRERLPPRLVQSVTGYMPRSERNDQIQCNMPRKLLKSTLVSPMYMTYSLPSVSIQFKLTHAEAQRLRQQQSQPNHNI